jgi:hypothetical protein
MKKTMFFLLILSLFSIPMVLADRDLIINGGFETGDMTGWESNGPSAVSGGYTGSYSASIEWELSMSQTYFDESIPTSDLTFYAKTVDTDVESSIVVWIYYQNGGITTNTLGPVTNTWQMFTATTDKTEYISKIAFRTYDENFDGNDKEGPSAYDEEKLLDDISLSVKVPTIISSETDGTPKNAFDYMESVHVKGMYYPPMPGGAFRSFDVYVVDDTTWADGMTIPSALFSYYGFGQAVIMPGTDGVLGPTGVVAGSYWDGSGIELSWLDPGLYDVVIDVNHNGKYDVGIDALDDNDIETGGIKVVEKVPDFVVPEIPYGSAMALAVMLATLILVNKRTQSPMFSI